MGLTFTKLFSRLFSKKEMRILMVRAVVAALLLSGVCRTSLASKVSVSGEYNLRKHALP